jgi:hypothetical protein
MAILLLAVRSRVCELDIHLESVKWRIDRVRKLTLMVACYARILQLEKSLVASGRDGGALATGPANNGRCACRGGMELLRGRE